MNRSRFIFLHMDIRAMFFQSCSKEKNKSMWDKIEQWLVSLVLETMDLGLILDSSMCRFGKVNLFRSLQLALESYRKD